MDNESLPYRTAVPSQVVTADSQNTSRDEDNYDTLKAVHKALKLAVDDLDKWHAFDLEEKDHLTLKQQIKAHQLTFDILAPLLDTIESAVQKVDNKYRER